MITLEGVLIRIPDLPTPDLERWIVNDWVRPDGEAGSYAFQEIDVARIRLIQELRDQLEINDAALPLVLRLLDQLYDLRRSLQDLAQARREV